MTEGQIPRKALLVEDETLVAMIAEEILGMIGFAPICVDNGADALAVLRDGGAALAVIDVGLPDMRGDALAAQARALHPDMAIVLASGYDAAELRAKFAGDTKVAVLGKPYTVRDLREAIASTGLPGIEV